MANERVDTMEKSRILKKWHVMKNKNTGEHGYYYYDADDYSKDEWQDEFGGNYDDYEEIPKEKWSAAQISEILANCMEDCNMHRSLYWPGLVLNAISGLDNNTQKEVMQHVMDEMLEHHLY